MRTLEGMSLRRLSRPGMTKSKKLLTRNRKSHMRMELPLSSSVENENKRLDTDQSIGSGNTKNLKVLVTLFRLS
jgi:hypothetical protein